MRLAQPKAPAISTQNHQALQPLVKLLLSIRRPRPLIVGLAGHSGVGKSSIAKLLHQQLEAAGKHVWNLSYDNFVYPLGDPRRTRSTWDLDQIDLAEAHRVLQAIARRDKKISLTWRNQLSETTVSETVFIQPLDVIIFEGLHVLGTRPPLNFLDYVHVPIFIDAHASDLQRWRFARETLKTQPRSRKAMQGLWPYLEYDYAQHIAPSKKNAWHVIEHASDHTYTLDRKSTRLNSSH